MDDGFDIAAGNVSDVGVFVEEEGAGGVGVDEVVLFAGFGEDEDLGFGGDVEMVEDEVKKIEAV